MIFQSQAGGSRITSVTMGSTNLIGTLFTANKTLTTAQLDNLDVTPVQLVPAAGANTLIVPVLWTARTVKGGANAWTSPGNLHLRQAGTTFNWGAAISTLLNTAAPVDSISSTIFANTAPSPVLGIGAALNVFSTAAIQQGAGSDATIRMTVCFYIARLG
jgi:hypothetical protein